MKRTIANTNKYFNSQKRKKKIIIEAVHSSAQVEGSKTTKEELRTHFEKIKGKMK